MVWTTDSRLATLWLQKKRFCFRFFDSHLDNFWNMELPENSYGYLLKHGSSFAGAYSPGGLGVRRTPCDTEHDVTFSWSCDQGKITKTLWRYLYVLSSPKACAICMYSTALVLEETFSQTAFAVVSRTVPGMSEFTPLLLRSDQPGCATFQAHTCRARKLEMDETLAQNRS